MWPKLRPLRGGGLASCWLEYWYSFPERRSYSSFWNRLNWLNVAKYRHRLILQLGCDSRQLCVTPVVVWLTTTVFDSGLNFVTHSKSVWLWFKFCDSLQLFVTLVLILWLKETLCDSGYCCVTHSNYVWIRLLCDSQQLSVTLVIILWITETLCDSGYCCVTHSKYVWIRLLCDSQKLCVTPVIVVWLTANMCESGCCVTHSNSVWLWF